MRVTLGSDESLVRLIRGRTVRAREERERMRDLVRRTALVALAAGSVSGLAVASPALAADTVPPAATAAFAAPPNGNNNWRITAPQTLNVSATDDVAVAKVQYSLDG